MSEKNESKSRDTQGNPWVVKQLGRPEQFTDIIDEITGTTKQQRLNQINEKIESRKQAYQDHIEKLKALA